MTKPWRRWADGRLAVLFFLVGLAAGIYLHWPALKNPSTYKSDMRQGPHWVAFHETSFRDDDPILEYAYYNVSPLQNTIYWVATLFGDVLWVSKVMAVLSYGLLSAIFFVVGRLWFGARFGALLALFITFFPISSISRPVSFLNSGSSRRSWWLSFSSLAAGGGA